MEIELKSSQIPNLKEFVSHLTQTMHSSVPGSLVIWQVFGDTIFPVTSYLPPFVIVCHFKFMFDWLLLIVQV